MEYKKNLRTKYRTRRRELSDEEVFERSQAICQRIHRNLPLVEFKSILFYYPAPNMGEVDLRPLFRIAFEELKDARCFLPRVYPEQKEIRPHMIPNVEVKEGDELREYYSLSHPDNPLEEGMFGIPEPRPDLCPLVEPEDLELVFVPGIVFDRDGFRIGFGGGYYDRLLNKLPESTVTVGVGYHWQIIDQCPREDHDIRVEWIFSEKESLQTDPV